MGEQVGKIEDLAVGNYSINYTVAPSVYKWEYMALSLTVRGGKVDTLNAYGAEGWELVCADEGWFIFKRPKDAIKDTIDLMSAMSKK